MGSVHIEFDPPGYRPAEDFDFLTRKAAQLLADLFPGVRVVLKYKKEQEYPPIPGATSVSHVSVDLPGLLQSSFQKVPGEPSWWRELSLIMSDAGRHFLGFGSPGFGSKPAESGRELPRELVYAAAICEDVARAWTIHIDKKALMETKISLSAQLPVWIVSHIVADLWYSFGTYGSGKGKHDIVARTVAESIGYLENLAATRVEHQELSHGVIIARPSRTDYPLKVGIYPDDFQRLKRTALLADGVRAALWISPAGEPIGWLTRESLQQPKKRSSSVRSPFGALGFLADASRSLRGLSLTLRSDGSLIIFAKGRPLFVRRVGRWRGMLWNAVREAMSGKYGEVGVVIFDAAVILSTSGRGGVLGIVERVPPGLDEKDRVDIAREKISAFNPELLYSISTKEAVVGQLPRHFQDMYPEWLFHALLPDDQVVALGPSVVSTLAAIDGATVVDKKGKLLVYGAVIPSHPSGSEGSRSAAARELSNYGLVVKVSADGPIALYEGGKEILEV